MRFWLIMKILVTISCFRTFLIFIQSYIFIICIYFKCFFLYLYIYICLWSKKKFESYFRDRLTFSNVDSRTSRRIYRLALLLRAPETLSSLSKSRISIFNAHLTLLVRKMTSHNSIGKYRHLVKLTWNLPWNGASPFADQTSRMQNWKEVNIWSSTVYSCDFLFSWR